MMAPTELRYESFSFLTLLISSEICGFRQAIGLRNSKVTVLVSTASASTSSGESSSDGRPPALKTLKSSTTTKEINDHHATDPSR
jgi:hypothetical protein